LVREMASMVVAIWEQHASSDVIDKSQLIVDPGARDALGVV
jgi:hypothetical protein